MKIALLVPSWPPGRSPNGIVTYASQLVPALRRLGHEVFIITVPLGDSDPYTIDIRQFDRPRTLWTRVEYKLMPDHARYKGASARLTSATKYLIAAHGVDILEVEE